jgi:hypothetical protein
VAVWDDRATFREPVELNKPVAGSYNSALADALTKSWPPTTKIVPFWSKVAVASARAAVILPVKLH